MFLKQTYIVIDAKVPWQIKITFKLTCQTFIEEPVMYAWPDLPEHMETMGLENGKNDTIVLTCVTQFWVCVQQYVVCNKLKLVVNNC